MSDKSAIYFDDELITKAKIYAKKKGISLSKLIENYLRFIIESENKDPEITPVVKSISGILDISNVKDIEKEYKKHLIKKYTR